MGHADEALELLTGVPAGKRLPDGAFEPDTVNYRVDQKLKQMMELAKDLMRGEEGPGKSSGPAASCPPAASNVTRKNIGGGQRRPPPPGFLGGRASVPANHVFSGFM